MILISLNRLYKILVINVHQIESVPNVIQNKTFFLSLTF